MSLRHSLPLEFCPDVVHGDRWAFALTSDPVWIRRVMAGQGAATADRTSVRWSWPGAPALAERVRTEADALNGRDCRHARHRVLDLLLTACVPGPRHALSNTRSPRL